MGRKKNSPQHGPQQQQWPGKKNQTLQDILAEVLEDEYQTYLKKQNIEQKLLSEDEQAKFFVNFVDFYRQQGWDNFEKILNENKWRKFSAFEKYTLDLDTIFARENTFKPGEQKKYLYEVLKSELPKKIQWLAIDPALKTQLVNDLSAAPTIPEMEMVFVTAKRFHPQYLNEFAKLSFSNLEIAESLNQLTNAGVLNALSTVDYQYLLHAPVNQRPHEIKPFFLNLISQQFLDNYMQSYERLEATMETVASIFQMPGIKDLLKWYQYDDTTLMNFDPTLSNVLSDPNFTEDQRNQERIRVYLAIIRSQDIDLAVIIEKFLEVKDYSKLPTELQKKLSQKLLKSKLSDHFKKNLNNLVGHSEPEFEQFLESLCDMDSKKLVFPGGHELKVLSKNMFEGTHTINSLHDLAEKTDFPLNMRIEYNPFLEQLLESGNDMFSFGNKRIHPSFRVRLTKRGTQDEPIEWYLAKVWERDGQPIYKLYSKSSKVLAQDRQIHPGFFTPQEYDCSVVDTSVDVNTDDISRLLYAHYLLGAGVETAPMAQKVDQLKKNAENLEENLQKVKNKLGKGTTDLEAEETKNSIRDNRESTEQLFLDEWNNLEWYSFKDPQYAQDFGLRPGTQLMFSAGDSSFPGYGQHWARLVIDQVNADSIVFKMYGWERTIAYKDENGNDVASEWAVVKIPKTAAALRDLKSASDGRLYKMPPLNCDNFGRELMDFHFLISDEHIKNGFQNMAKYALVPTRPVSLKVRDVEKDPEGDPENYAYPWEEVKYFWFTKKGKSYNDLKALMYKVEFVDKDKVKVTYMANLKGWMSTDPSDVRGGKIMDYASFLMMVSDKWLKWYTQKQFDYLAKWEQALLPPESFWLKFYSLGNLKYARKNVKKIIPERLKAKQEKKNVAFEEWLVNKVGIYKLWAKLPFVGKAFQDMDRKYQSGYDSKLFEEITKKKSDMEKESKYNPWGPASSMAKLLADWGPSGPWDKTYESCAGLLFLIENGWMYQRDDLRKFVGKGAWVRLLLWKEYQQKYLHEVQQKIAIAKQAREWDVNSEEYIDEIVKSEINFIVNTLRGASVKGKPEIDKDGKTKDTFIKTSGYMEREIFSVQFTNTLEWAYKALNGTEKSRKVEAEQKEQNSFSQILDNYWWEIKKWRLQPSVGCLKALASKVNSQEEAYQFYGALIASIVSWYYRNEWSQADKREIIGVARRLGFPLAYYLNDYNGPEKTFTILKVFARKTGKTDADFFKNRSPEKISRENYGDNYKKIVEDFKGRWMGSGYDEIKNAKQVIDTLSLRNLSSEWSLFKLISPETSENISSPDYVTPEEKKIFADFLNKSNEKDTESGGWDRAFNNKFFYKISAFNLDNAVVRNDLMNYVNGQFRTETREFAPEFWRNVTKAVDGFESTEDLKSVEFITSKFASWFQNSLFSQQNWKKIFLQLLRYAKDNPDKAQEAMYEAIMNQQLAYLKSARSLPPEIQDTLRAFTKFFAKHVNLLNSEIVDVAFGGSSVQVFNQPVTDQKYEDIKSKIKEQLNKLWFDQEFLYEDQY